MSGIYLGAIFPSWEAFETVLNKWYTEKNVLFIKGSGKSVEKHNSELPPGQKKLHTSLKYQRVQFYCKSGMQRKSESTGIRKKQRSLKLGCKATFVVTAQQGRTQTLKITTFRNKHEYHETTKEFAQFYPENRRLNAEEKETVDLMTKARGKPLNIRDQLRNTTQKAVTSQDLANLRRQLNLKNKKGNTELDDALGELKHLLETDSGAKTSVAYDVGSGVIEYLYFQTSQMSKVLEQYPEVIGMDTTYKLNKNNMHLVVILCIDNHGNGRVVGYCFLRRETADILEGAVTCFRDQNPEAAKDIQTVIVDKDYKEIGGIRKVLPHVQVHLCHVHVMRAFDRNCRSETSRKDIMATLKKMSQSGSKVEFEKQYEKLKEVASAEFMKYFDENWKDIDEAWVLYVRNTSLTLGVRSTNHVESQNQKIKSVTDRSNTLGECIRALKLLHKNTEFESSYKDFRELGTRLYIANCEDDDVKVIMNSFSDWAADLLYKEWERSCYTETDTEVVTEEDTGTCSCNFFAKFGLQHCEHIFRLRRAQDKPIVDVTGVRKRWLKPTRSNETSGEPAEAEAVELGPEVQVIPRKTPLGPKPRSETDKYNVALRLCNQISSLISMTGGTQCEDRLNLLRKLISIWESRREAVVVPVGDVAVDWVPAPQENQIINYVNGVNDDEALECTSTSDCDAPSETFDEEVNVTFERICRSCQQPMERFLTKSNKNGNQNRYHWTCSKRCSFQWDKCHECGTNDVRLDHKCTSEGHGSTFVDGWSGNEQVIDSDTQEPESPQPTFDLGFEEFLKDLNGNAGSDVDLNLGSNMDSNLGLDVDSNVGLDVDSNLGSDMDSNLGSEADLNLGSVGSMRSDGIAGSAGSDRHTPEENTDSDNNSVPPNPGRDVDQILQPQREHRAGSHLDAGSIAGSKSQENEENEQNASNEIQSSLTQEDEHTEIMPDEEDNKTQLRRQRGENIKDTDVKKIAPYKWTVVSSKDRKLLYRITGKAMKCQRSPCITKRHPCMHRYVCTCPDSVNPCKHIFKVHGLDCPHEIVESTTSNRDDQISSRHEHLHQGQHVAQNLNLQDFAALQKSLSLPPAQKVIGRPNIMNTKQTGSWMRDKTPARRNETNTNSGPQQLQCNNCSMDSPQPGHKCCVHCKKRNVRIGHLCSCIVCQKPVRGPEVLSCYRCTRPVHDGCSYVELAKEKENVLRICKYCRITRDTGLCIAAFHEISQPTLLSDNHFLLASNILKETYPDITGLLAPANVVRNKEHYEMKYEKYHQGDYVQFMHNGQGHWILLIVQKGKPHLLDSNYHDAVNSEVEAQIASIMYTEEPTFDILIPDVQQQDNSVDCGLYAIANAFEFALTRKIQHVNFSRHSLRSHWLECVENRRVIPFPKDSNQPVQHPTTRFTTTEVICICRLPEHYSKNIVGCDGICDTWYHWQCVGLTSAPPPGEWICTSCTDC